MSDSHTQTQNHPWPIRVDANREARARKAIIFCCDQGYLPYAAFAATRIRLLHPDADFDICICAGQQPIAVPESLAALDLRLCTIDVGATFEGLRLDRGKTHDVYLRLALPNAFAEEYDRILYLDADIYVQEGDFAALLGLEIGEHALAAVRDNLQWRTPTKQTARNAMPHMKGRKYFNAGVCLMDVRNCLRMGLLDACVSYGRKHADVLVRHDQNLLNAVLNGEWAEIGPTWNWQFSWSARFFSALYGPNIIHFIGAVKPWCDALGEIEPRFANEMRRFVNAHFHDQDFDRMPRARLAPNSRRFTRMLFKHLLSRHKIARYLARFPDDQTVYL